MSPASSTPDRPVGMPMLVLYVGIPAYVGAVGFSVWQIFADNSTTVSVLAVAGIALFTVLLAWVQWLPTVAETDRRRLVLVVAIGLIAVALMPVGGADVMYLITVSGVAGFAVRARLALTIISLAAVAVVVIGAVNDFLPRETFQSVVITLVVGLFTFGAKRLADTTNELLAAREELADLAVVNERLRISRDLHDLLGHGLTVIRAKSELASRVSASDPERAAREMTEVESIARQALVDVREAVANYRRPTLAGERANARTALAAAGIAAEFSDDSVALSPETDETLAWVLREAVTNVVRHSGAARCHVRTADEGDAVRLEVIDEGSGGRVSSVDGSGLTGLRERVAAAGGTLEVGELTGGGFGVVARIPATT